MILGVVFGGRRAKRFNTLVVVCSVPAVSLSLSVYVIWCNHSCGKFVLCK